MSRTHPFPNPIAIATASTRIGWLAALLATGCATLGDHGQALVPTRYLTRTGPYAVFTNAPISPDAPAIRHLQSLDHQVGSALGTRIDPGEHPIEVYVLDDREAFMHFLKFYYPGLPPRRAFFLAQGPRRVVYAYRGDRLEEDLRHEATHALLNVAVADLPLWLDEGLAEYFENPDDLGGRNPEHLARLPSDRAKGWTPDLPRLEALADVRQMTPRDYRESWAWVHYLLNGPPAGKAALVAYLSDLHSGRRGAPLSERLEGAGIDAPGDRLLAHLDRLPDRPIAASAPPVDPTVRLQDSPAEPGPEPEKPRRRGILARIGLLFGGD